ncbi:hypothetical protein IAE16_04580 [Hydrogenobacter sp. T-2]|uniref:hypothetical protein n=1 Tax=Pampinifervens diazotrophicum TaxID=1632018 RepID=UPI002B25979A|nr:hypothetical protein [Hydrogenobacter sp. T-2]WPM32959.1 hypothetical protein IAE16_04580 [Hydrogenobacter sp. T-2]
MRFLVFILVLGLLLSYSLAKEVPFTLEDRDRIIRLEENQREGFRALMQRIDDTNKRIDDINKRIDDTNKRIDDMISIMLWGFGVLFAGMMSLIGFVIWDRRSALAPAIRKTKELEEREEKIEKALKKLAEKIQK